MLKEFVTWLASNVSGVTVGTDLFAGHIPQTAQDDCSCVMERTGGRVDGFNEKLYELHYQIYTRATTYFTARDAAYALFDACVNAWGHTLSGTSSGDSDWLLMTTQGIAPAYIGQDEKSRFVFSANLTLQAKKET